MSNHDGRRAQECGAYDRKARGSARNLRVFDLKAAVTPSLLGPAYACTANGLKAALIRTCRLVIDVLFRIGLRSTPRNREVQGTTESFLDVDGTPRRQSDRNACLKKSGRDSQTYAT